MRIACLNAGHADWAYDLRTWDRRAAALAALVESERVDVLVLQEIFVITYRETEPTMREYLAKLGLPARDFDKLQPLLARLPSSFAAYPSLIPSQDRGVTTPGLYWGLAFVSRIPLGPIRVRELTYSNFDRWPRIVQCAAGGALKGPLFNVHFAAENLQARQRGVLEALCFVQEVGERLSVCVGDFNDTFASSPVLQMRARLDDMWKVATQKAVLVDGRSADPSSNLARICVEGRIDHGFVERSVRVASMTYHFQTVEPLLADHPLMIVELG